MIIDSRAKMKILLVEDDIALLRGLEYTLTKDGYEVSSVSTISEARKAYTVKEYSLILLDVGLPDGSGWDLCREIRMTSDIPVIFLTACDDEVNIVLGLDLGGDDYITKPFRVNELLSRIKAVLRRKSPTPREKEIISPGEFTVDRKNYRIEKNGTAIPLTLTEYKLITALIGSKGVTITRDSLMESIWDSEGHYVDANTLSVYIRRLREKIETDPEKPKHIITVRGLGYRWE